MPGRDYVAELWPELIALEEHLDAMTSRTYEITTKNRADDDDDEFADRVHRALLRKQRSGPLGLNQ